MRTLDPTANGFVVSTKHPPGPRSVVRVEKRAPDPSSTTSADAVNIWRPVVRRSASFSVVVASLAPRYDSFFQLSAMLAWSFLAQGLHPEASGQPRNRVPILCYSFEIV